jgi:hypothetical protein
MSLEARHWAEYLSSIRSQAARGAGALEAPRWAEYFSSIATGERYLASVGLLTGPAQSFPRTAWRPLRAIVYDAEQDVLEVAVANGTPNTSLRFFITAPRKVGVEESGAGRAIVVEDASGERTLIRLCPDGAA